MSSIEYLNTVSAPFLTTVAEPEDVMAEALGWLDSALLVRGIRGRKTRALDGLFDEFAAAFQFPYHFGENWSAFRDCVSDLDWLPFQSGVVLLVYDAVEVLVDTVPAELARLVQTLAVTAEQFAEVVDDGEWWDRDPVPFHVVLHGTSPADFERWIDAGAMTRQLSFRR